MPKVQLINKAGKDYPQFGIKKGESHYVWSIKMQRGGLVRRSKTYPRQSQLTLSEYKIAAHQLNEQLEDFSADTVEEISSFIDELKSEADDLREQQQEKLDNMPEGLQQGDTGQQIQERIDALESFVSELENFDIVEFEEDEEHEEWSEENRVNGDGETEDEVVEKLMEELKAIQLDVC